MRRTTLNKRIEQVLEYIRAGHTISSACALAGVPRASFYKRLERSEKLQAQVEKAEAELVSLALGNIRNALMEGDIKVALWVLERVEPERWTPTGALKAREEARKPTDIEPEFVVFGEDSPPERGWGAGG
jgi:hypothetical protein